MSKLVIVESPAKAKTIQKYLGKGYDVIASMGHVRDLPENRLSVDVKKHFQPKYTVIKGKEKLVEELEKMADKSEAVFLATDPDREGEAISWHLAYLLKLDPEDQNRVTFYFSCDQTGKLIPVHRQSASGGNLGLVGAFHQQRVKAPHFLLQQAGGAFHPARFQRIGANQLRHILTVMSRRIFFRLHFIQGHLGAGIGRLPSGFTSCQAPAYYVNFHPGLPPVHSRILL